MSDMDKGPYYFFSYSSMKFKEAQAKTVAMLSSPGFIERVKDEDETMLTHLDILKNINRAGYITTNSQAGRKSSGKSAVDGRHYDTSERAYITGFMLENDAVKFIKNLGILTDKNAVFVPYCSDDIHLPASLDIPLTITRKGDKTAVVTHMATTLPVSYWNHERKEAKLSKSEKIVYIFCWDTKWNRNASSATGLFTDVLKILRL
jgi:hypothetical protein